MGETDQPSAPRHRFTSISTSVGEHGQYGLGMTLSLAPQKARFWAFFQCRPGYSRYNLTSRREASYDLGVY
jgi:hypothetical protein